LNESQQSLPLKTDISAH